MGLTELAAQAGGQDVRAPASGQKRQVVLTS
jgi:hypothetical protein